MKERDKSSKESERKESDKYFEVRNQLPPKMRSIFDELVDDYRDVSLNYFSRSFVSFAILADLVRLGWRKKESEEK